MISIIILTYNEEDQIAKTIEWVGQKNNSCYFTEVIVVDGGSNDRTKEKAEKAGAKFVISPQKGRAVQMNYAASIANGDILYFLHADCLPPKDFAKKIIESVNTGYKSGCFRLQFDEAHWFLKANCWFTRFNINQFRFGDQSLFVTAGIFKKAGGFNKKMIVLEDQEIISRIRKYTKFKVMNAYITTSARKYLLNGIYKTQAVYYLIYAMYQLRFSQQKLVRTYTALINQNKIE